MTLTASLVFAFCISQEYNKLQDAADDATHACKKISRKHAMLASQKVEGQQDQLRECGERLELAKQVMKEAINNAMDSLKAGQRDFVRYK